jgi:hypothetical protein
LGVSEDLWNLWVWDMIGRMHYRDNFGVSIMRILLVKKKYIIFDENNWIFGGEIDIGDLL